MRKISCYIKYDWLQTLSVLELVVFFRLQSSLLAQLQEDLQKSLQETIQKEVTSVLVEQSVFNNDSRNEAQHKHTQVR